MADDCEFLKQQVEAADAKQQAAALQGVCVYCGEFMQYESMEQKCGAVGNQMRIDHIRQCAARPELKLIAYAEQLEAERDALHANAGKLKEALVGVARYSTDTGDCWCEIRRTRNNEPREDSDHDADCGAARAVLADAKEN